MTSPLRPLVLALALAGAACAVPPGAPSAVAQTRIVDAADFGPVLAPYGSWFVHPAHGRLWRPHGVGAGWRPYTNGHWRWYEGGRWLWVADEPWGWAPYHYGRWIWLDSMGWAWRPGTVWAPSWVVWRYGDGYTGWAPVPYDTPDSWAGRAYGTSFGMPVGGWVSRVPAGQWVFVRAPAFLHPHVGRIVVPPGANRRLCDTVREAEPGGPRRDDVGRDVGRRPEPVRLENADRPGRPEHRGDVVRLYRPGQDDDGRGDGRAEGRRDADRETGRDIVPDAGAATGTGAGAATGTGADARPRIERGGRDDPDRGSAMRGPGRDEDGRDADGRDAGEGGDGRDRDRRGRDGDRPERPPPANAMGGVPDGRDAARSGGGPRPAITRGRPPEAAPPPTVPATPPMMAPPPLVPSGAAGLSPGNRGAARPEPDARRGDRNPRAEMPGAQRMPPPATGFAAPPPRQGANGNGGGAANGGRSRGQGQGPGQGQGQGQGQGGPAMPGTP